MYVLAWILVALSAVLYEVLKWVHFKCDKKWKDMKKAGYVVRYIYIYIQLFAIKSYA